MLCGLRVSEMPALLGNVFKSMVTSSRSPLIIAVGTCLKGVPCKLAREFSFIVLTKRLTGRACS